MMVTDCHIVKKIVTLVTDGHRGSHSSHMITLVFGVHIGTTYVLTLDTDGH